MTSVEDFLEDAEEPPPPTNRGWLLAVLVAIVSFVVWILVGDFIGRAQSSPAAQPTVTVTVTVGAFSSTPTNATTAATADGSPTTATAPASTAPTALPAGGTELLHLAGFGRQTSRPFAVSRRAFRLSYAYNCAAFGSIGAFQVNLQRGSVQVDLLTNELGSGGSAITRADDGPGVFYLLINTPCAWTVRVSQ